MKPVTASQTSAVFVTDDTFEEPMEYPQGANMLPGACKPTLVVGSKTRA